MCCTRGQQIKLLCYLEESELSQFHLYFRPRSCVTWPTLQRCKCHWLLMWHGKTLSFRLQCRFLIQAEFSSSNAWAANILPVSDSQSASAMLMVRAVLHFRIPQFRRCILSKEGDGSLLNTDSWNLVSLVFLVSLIAWMEAFEQIPEWAVDQEDLDQKVVRAFYHILWCGGFMLSRDAWLGSSPYFDQCSDRGALVLWPSLWVVGGWTFSPVHHGFYIRDMAAGAPMGVPTSVQMLTNQPPLCKHTITVNKRCSPELALWLECTMLGQYKLNNLLRSLRSGFHKCNNLKIGSCLNTCVYCMSSFISNVALHSKVLQFATCFTHTLSGYGRTHTASGASLRPLTPTLSFIWMRASDTDTRREKWSFQSWLKAWALTEVHVFFIYLILLHLRCKKVQTTCFVQLEGPLESLV